MMLRWWRWWWFWWRCNSNHNIKMWRERSRRSIESAHSQSTFECPKFRPSKISIQKLPWSSDLQGKRPPPSWWWECCCCCSAVDVAAAVVALPATLEVRRLGCLDLGRGMRPWRCQALAWWAAGPWVRLGRPQEGWVRIAGGEDEAVWDPGCGWTGSGAAGKAEGPSVRKRCKKGQEEKKTSRVEFWTT